MHHKTRKQQDYLLIQLLFIIVQEFLTSENRLKKIHIEEEAIKFYLQLTSLSMYQFQCNLKRKLVEVTNKISEAVGHMITIHKLVIFLYFSREQ